VRAAPSGHKLKVGDLAEVTDGFDEDAGEDRRRSVRAVELHVERALGNNALEVADAVDAYVAQLPEILPANLQVEVHDVAADLIRDCIDLLLCNVSAGCSWCSPSCSSSSMPGLRSGSPPASRSRCSPCSGCCG
jgi:multidrug efflux pump subunit AcrB